MLSQPEVWQEGPEAHFLVADLDALQHFLPSFRRPIVDRDCCMSLPNGRKKPSGGGTNDDHTYECGALFELPHDVRRHGRFLLICHGWSELRRALPGIDCRLADNDKPIIERWLTEESPRMGLIAEGDTAGATPSQPTVCCSADSDAIPREMRPAYRKAYLAFQYAESKAGKRLQDREAYELLKDEGIPTDKGDLGQLADYELPAFATWSRQVRKARKLLGDQKYTPRAGRTTSKSVVKREEI